MKTLITLVLFAALASSLNAQTDTATVIIHDLDSLVVTYTPACSPDPCRARPGTVINFTVVSVTDPLSGEDLTDLSVVRWRVTENPNAVTLDSITGTATVRTGQQFRLLPYVVDIAGLLAIFVSDIDAEPELWQYAMTVPYDVDPIHMPANVPDFMCTPAVPGEACSVRLRRCAYGVSTETGAVIFKSSDILTREYSDDRPAEVLDVGAPCPANALGQIGITRIGPVTWEVVS